MQGWLRRHWLGTALAQLVAAVAVAVAVAVDVPWQLPVSRIRCYGCWSPSQRCKLLLRAGAGLRVARLQSSFDEKR
jgi:hypothetical protein